MTEEKQSIRDDYHLEFGGILHMLAIAKYFTPDVLSVGPSLLRRLFASG